MIERDFDVPFIADIALREKQIQQNYRPIIAVHKWFARRPGTLFRGLLLSEFVKEPLRESFYKGHCLSGIRVADPFMGGGTPLLEANRIGCDIVGFDINPMAYWIVKQEIEHLDLDAYLKAAHELMRNLENRVGRFYRTRCRECGSPDAHVKYFIWVKTLQCRHCGSTYDLYPGYLLAENKRHPLNVLICPSCGELNEVRDRKYPGNCHSCGRELQVRGPATRNHCTCPYCGSNNEYPDRAQGAPLHRMVAIEYYCKKCKPRHEGRFFKRPDMDDLRKLEEVKSELENLDTTFIPDDPIPAGDETDRLHRWGYEYYHQMFNDRQLLGLAVSCQLIAEQPNERIRNALATNLSDLLRYQNMLCRYDTMALKSLDIFSVHGFPVGLVQCESNLLGISNGREGMNVGSGGWSNIADKFYRAKDYCDHPFETRHFGNRRIQVPVADEWIGESRVQAGGVESRDVHLQCTSATSASLVPASLDAVLTDPPYFANVQYAELMDFCYVWLRRLVLDSSGAFRKGSTRDPEELTGNITMDRGIEHFAEGMSAVFRAMAQALKPGSPFSFTYHHNTIEAYTPIAAAILDAGLTCSASIPCPAEMGASIHINGTGSSVVDTVFICRSKGTVPRSLIVSTAEEIAGLIRKDIELLRRGKLEPTHGDIRCIAFGHLIRLAIWFLRKEWAIERPTKEKLDAVMKTIRELGEWPALQPFLSDDLQAAPPLQSWEAKEQLGLGGVPEDEISF